jgi:hypothetical protein
MDRGSNECLLPPAFEAGSRSGPHPGNANHVGNSQRWFLGCCPDEHPSIASLESSIDFVQSQCRPFPGRGRVEHGPELYASSAGATSIPLVRPAHPSGWPVWLRTSPVTGFSWPGTRVWTVTASRSGRSASASQGSSPTPGACRPGRRSESTPWSFARRASRTSMRSPACGVLPRRCFPAPRAPEHRVSRVAKRRGGRRVVADLDPEIVAVPLALDLLKQAL